MSIPNSVPSDTIVVGYNGTITEEDLLQRWESQSHRAEEGRVARDARRVQLFAA